jgi:polysaccharide biosynthesis protein PslH
LSTILFLSQLLPYPADTGAKVRSYYTLRYLAQKHQVTLLAFSREDDPQMAIEHLKVFCTNVYTVPIQRSRLRDIRLLTTSFLRGKSFVIRRDFFPEMADKVESIMESGSFDAVHADQLWMAQYAFIAKTVKADVRLILDEHNACFQIFQRLAKSEKNFHKKFLLKREWPALQRYEAWACSQFDHVVTVTNEDRNILTNMIPASFAKKQDEKFSTIPICVNTEEIRPVQPAPATKNVFHLGTMFYLPNITGMLWFVREVWPLVLAQMPQAILTIAGKNPPAVIQQLSSSSIQVTGYLPDPLPHLERASVFIVPLLAGGGMRVKIIEAWRWGLPVVSTLTGAEGIEYRDGENILIADDAEDFANAVVRVLSEPDFAQSLRENGRCWVEQRYDWQQVYPAWDTIYQTTTVK